MHLKYINRRAKIWRLGENRHFNMLCMDATDCIKVNTPQHYRVCWPQFGLNILRSVCGCVSMCRLYIEYIEIFHKEMGE